MGFIERLHSKEIIEKTRASFNIGRLQGKIADDKSEFLAEGERQIHDLWHGIEALTVHNTMFVVLFLLSIGEILNEVREQLPLSEFVRWRRRVFDPKQERYLQQAQQLAEMGDFAKKYASMGKKRLLALDKLRKDENEKTFDVLFEDHPIPEEVEDSVLNDEELKDNPFPDSTEDHEGGLLKEHVDALITYHRLKSAGINFVSFDQAYLIAAYKRNAISIKRAENVAKWVKEKGTVRTQKKWFNFLVMNKMVSPNRKPGQSAPSESLNSMLNNFVEYCKDRDFRNQDWVAQQKELISDDFVIQANRYLKIVARAFDISLTNRRSTR
jgi:hypothetical protein